MFGSRMQADGQPFTYLDGSPMVTEAVLQLQSEHLSIEADGSVHIRDDHGNIASGKHLISPYATGWRIGATMGRANFAIKGATLTNRFHTLPLPHLDRNAREALHGQV